MLGHVCGYGWMRPSEKFIKKLCFTPCGDTRTRVYFDDLSLHECDEEILIAYGVHYIYKTPGGRFLGIRSRNIYDFGYDVPSINHIDGEKWLTHEERATAHKG